MTPITSHIPPGTARDEDGQSVWPHPTIEAGDPDPATHAVGSYLVIHADGDECSGFDQLTFASIDADGIRQPGHTMEGLLATVEHRLAGFESGPHRCQENANALHHVRYALAWLHGRSVRLASERASMADFAQGLADAVAVPTDDDPDANETGDLDEPAPTDAPA